MLLIAQNLLTLANEGISVTLIGMGIVFAVLALLWGVLELMRVFFYKPEQPVVAPVPVAAAPAPAPEPVVVEEPIATDNYAVIAAITAAVAQFMEVSVEQVQLRSVRRVNDSGSAWKAAARGNVGRKG